MSKVRYNTRKLQARLSNRSMQKPDGLRHDLFRMPPSRRKEQKLIMEMWENYLTFTGLGI